MSLPLSERIAARLLLKDGTSKARLKADFLAHKVDIAAAMAQGWSIHAIWETLNAEGKIRVTYQAFCNQVHRWMTDNNGHPASPEIKPSPHVSPKKIAINVSSAHSVKGETAPVDGFKFSATPNSEDLF